MKKTILLSKTGLTLYTESAMGNASAVGESNDTLGVMRFLADRYADEYNLVYIGSWHGDLHPKWQGIQIDHSKVQAKDLYLCGEFQREAAIDAALQIPGEEFIFIDIPAAPPTKFWIDNPDFTKVQQCSAKYCIPYMVIYDVLPQLLEYGIDELRTADEVKEWPNIRIPRILIINDPRSYVNNHEVEWYHPDFVPCAVLSQENRQFEKAMKYSIAKITAVHSGAENWFSYQHPLMHRYDVPRDIDFGILGHSHISTSRVPNRHRDAMWAELLGSVIDAAKRGEITMRVHGSGWEQFSLYDPEFFPGPMQPARIYEFLSRVRCGCIIPIGDRFATAKLAQYATMGTIPFLYTAPLDSPETQCHTYDAEYRYVSEESALRVSTGDELLESIRWVVDENSLHSDLALLQRRVKPDFRKLEHVIEDAFDGRLPNTQEYGSYAIRRV
jgi:hypothetical protein